MCDEFNMPEVEENEVEINLLKDGGKRGDLCVKTSQVCGKVDSR